MPLPHLPRASLLALACVTLPVSTLAEDAHHHQSAHVHGEARLQVAIDGHSAEVILQSPAANLLGFEHAPKTTEQEAAVADARQWLTATPIVQTADKDCTIAASSVDHEQSEEHEHEHEHEEERGHSDFEVTQRIECDSELTDPLSTSLMTRFPGIDHLSVDWLGAGGQGHTEVHSGEDAIHLEH